MDWLFYPASKIVWALIRPDTLLVLMLALGLLLLVFGRRRSAVWALTATLSGFIIIGVFPLGQLVAAPLENTYPANPDLSEVSGIIVLGGGEESDRGRVWNQATTNDAGDRFLAAILLTNRYPDAPVILTGRSGRVIAMQTGRATVGEATLLAAGISQERILVENRSRNTAENASFTRAMLGDQSGTWLLVTSAFHMRRSVASYCAEGWTGLVPWPTDFRSGVFKERIGWNPAANLQDLNDATKEWVGLIAYRLTGRAASAQDKQCVLSEVAAD